VSADARSADTIRTQTTLSGPHVIAHPLETQSQVKDVFAIARWIKGGTAIRRKTEEAFVGGAMPPGPLMGAKYFEPGIKVNRNATIPAFSSIPHEIMSTRVIHIQLCRTLLVAAHWFVGVASRFAVQRHEIIGFLREFVAKAESRPNAAQASSLARFRWIGSRPPLLGHLAGSHGGIVR
jgi:hypothetical protein